MQDYERIKKIRSIDESRVAPLPFFIEQKDKDIQSRNKYNKHNKYTQH